MPEPDADAHDADPDGGPGTGADAGRDAGATRPDDADPEPANAGGDDADGDQDAADEDTGDALPAGRRWARVAGVVSLAYVCWYVLGLVVLEIDPVRYNAFNQFTGSLGMRAVLALVALALLFHLFDGLRTSLEDLAPGWVRRDAGLRAAVGFCTFALWVPAATVLLWPAIRGWFA